MASSNHLFRLITHIHRLRKAAIARQKALLEKYGLSPLDWAILLSLYENPGQSQAAVARSIGRAPSNVRYPIELLEKRRYLQREADAGDRRMNLTLLSPEGEKLVNTLLPAFEASDKALLQGLSPKEQEELERLLHALAREQKNA